MNMCRKFVSVWSVYTSQAGGSADSLRRPDSEDDEMDPYIMDSDDSPPPPPPAAGAVLAEKPTPAPSSGASDVEPSLPGPSSEAYEVADSLQKPSSSSQGYDGELSLSEPSLGAYEVEDSLQEPSSSAGGYEVEPTLGEPPCGAGVGFTEHFSVDDIGPRSLDAMLAEIDSPDVRAPEEPSISASSHTSMGPGQDREKLLALVAAGTAKLAELFLFRIWSAVHAWAVVKSM